MAEFIVDLKKTFDTQMVVKVDNPGTDEEVLVVIKSHFPDSNVEVVKVRAIVDGECEVVEGE